jgi:hypothetical protein
MSATAAVAAGYTLAAGPVRAEIITTDTKGLEAGDIKIFCGRLVLPDGIELFLQSCFILILLYFSVQRSVFVWHSWVALSIQYHA